MNKHTAKLIIAGLSATLLVMVFMFAYEANLLDIPSEKLYQIGIVYIFFFTFFGLLTIPVGLRWAKPFLDVLDAHNKKDNVDEITLMSGQETVMRFPAKLTIYTFTELTISIAGVFLVLRYYLNYPLYEVNYLTLINFMTAIVICTVIYYIFKIMGYGFIQAIIEQRSRKDLNKHSFRLTILFKMFVSLFVLVLYFVSLSLIMSHSTSLKALQSKLEDENRYWISHIASQLENGEFGEKYLKNLQLGKFSNLYVTDMKGNMLSVEKTFSQEINNYIKNINDNIKEGSVYLRDKGITFSFRVLPENNIIIVLLSKVELPEAQASQLMRIFFLLLAGCFIFTSIAAPLMSNEVKYPLNKITAYLSDIMEGNPRDSLDVLTDDGFTDLSFAVLSMKRSLDMEKKRSQNLLYNISDTVTKQDNTAGLLVEISKNHAGSTSELHMAVQEALTTSEEIYATAAQIVENTSDVHKVAANTLDSCEVGKAGCDDTVKALLNLKNYILSISHKAGMLHSAGKSINDISESIRQVSEQTHLLSLNASLEATGAEKSSTHFNVVAEEVRRMSEHATEAADQIGFFTQSFEDEINATIEATTESISAVSETEKVVNQVKSALENVSSLASDTTQATLEINYSTKEQTNASRQMTDTISRISDVAKASENSASRIENTADGINDMTTYLKSLLDKVYHTHA